MSAQYVKAYVQRNKTDAADAAAIREAVGRPSMPLVAIKTAEQQAALLSAADLLPLRCGLINLDLQVMGSVGIVFPPGLVLLHIKLNQAILNRRDQGASFACQHAGPSRKGI
jgi:transposase